MQGETISPVRLTIAEEQSKSRRKRVLGRGTYPRMVQSIQGRDRAATGRATHALAEETCNNVELVEESAAKKQQAKGPKARPSENWPDRCIQRRKSS